MGNIVPRFANFIESLIDEFSTTLKLKDECIKGHPLLNNKPSNFIVICFIDVGCNQSSIVTYYIFSPIS
jgi:hypothetical protein